MQDSLAPDTQPMNNGTVTPDPKLLPPRRVEQLKRIVAGESIGDASKHSGYATKQSGSNALADTRKRLLAAMDTFGMTDVALVRDYLLPLLNATKTEFAKHEGRITDSVEVADNSTRLSSLDMALKLKGAYPKAEADVAAHLNITINNAAIVDTE
jgi:hypothetical protein